MRRFIKLSFRFYIFLVFLYLSPLPLWGAAESRLIPKVVTIPGQESGVSPGPGIGGRIGLSPLDDKNNVVWNGTCTITRTALLKAEYYIQADAFSGYHFKNWILPSSHGAYDAEWLGEYNASSNPAKMKTYCGNAYSYWDWYITAVFEANFKAKLTATTTAGASDSATVDGSASSVVKDVESSSSTLTFNIVAPEPSAGYYFSGWTGSGIADPSSRSTTVTVSPSTTAGGIAEYTVTANYAPYYYATLTGIATAGANGSVTIDGSASNTKNSTTAGATVSFSIVAPSAQSGYHFTGWSGTSISFANSGSLSTTASVTTSTNHGVINSAQYEACANYVQNIYYAKLSATQPSNGTVSITQSTKSTTTQSGNVTFDITATPATGYHLVSWSKVGSVGSFGNETATTTTFTAPAASNYGEGNATSYTITATFAKDQYYAKVVAAVSTYGNFSSPGTAQVKLNGTETYASEAIGAAETSQGFVPFNLKAEPNKGYKLIGWSNTNGVNDPLIDLSKTSAYRVKASDAEGQTNTYNVFAVYDKGAYTVAFDGNGSASGSMESQTLTSFTKGKLNKNAFVNNFVVTYDAQGGSCSTSSETKDRFLNWKVDGESTTYNDEAEITRTETHNSTVTLKAIWASSLNFTLPTPSKSLFGSNVQFLGWYDAESGGNKVGDAGESVSISASKTLYARWQECILTIQIEIGANTSSTNNDRVVFVVAHTSNQAVQYRISIPVGGSQIIKGIIPGTYTITPETPWSWNYTISDAQNASFTTTSTEAQQSQTVTFTVTSKNSTKKHDEVSNQKSY